MMRKAVPRYCADFLLLGTVSTDLTAVIELSRREKWRLSLYFFCTVATGSLLAGLFIVADAVSAAQTAAFCIQAENAVPTVLNFL